jgi:hypothetical protein
MKTKKVKFTIATNYVNSAWSETLEFTFDDDETDSEIESQIDEFYSDWLSEKNYGGWSIIEDLTETK